MQQACKLAEFEKRTITMYGQNNKRIKKFSSTCGVPVYFCKSAVNYSIRQSQLCIRQSATHEEVCTTDWQDK